MSKAKIGLWIYHNNGGEVIEQKIASQLLERGIESVSNLNLKTTKATPEGLVCQGQNILDLSCYFSYNCSGQTVYQVYFYQYLDAYIPTINNFKAFSITEDKFQTISLLSENHITTPDFCFCEASDTKSIEAFFHKHKKIVCKPIDGYGGQNLMLVEDLSLLKKFNGFNSKTGFNYFYAENYIDYDGSDFRVDIVNNQFVSCYGRKAQKGDWRTNVSSGGQVFCREGNEEIIAIAKHAATITGAEVAGVDIIFDREKQKYIVLEVNGLPAFATPEQEELGLNFNQKKIDLITDLIDQTVIKHEKIAKAA